MSLPNRLALAHSASAITQYSTLGFHLMKVSLWNHTVAPPSTTISPRLTHSMVSIFLPRVFSQATCSAVAAMTTSVDSSTGASCSPTMPPETMKPKCSVANTAAQSLWASAYL